MANQPECSEWKCTERGLCQEIGICHSWSLDVLMHRYHWRTLDTPGEDHLSPYDNPASSPSELGAQAGRQRALPILRLLQSP
jgi:hypothetical protein